MEGSRYASRRATIGQGWSRRRVLGLTAAAGGALVAPLVASPRSLAALADAGDANAAVTWDLNAQGAIWDVAQQQPNEQVRSFAMVSAAVYDAVNAAAGSPYQPYLLPPRPRSDASQPAAVAAAAHGVLVSMFPDQLDRLQEQYDEYLAGIPNGPSKSTGVAIGNEAAAALVAARENDGAFGDQQWRQGTEPGQWRPTPPTNASAGAWTGYMKPFLIRTVDEFRSPGPPGLRGQAYARDLEEVARIGSATSTVRTADQTEAAIFWHDRRSVNWGIKRQLAITQRLSLLETARMFALIDTVVADSGVACFREKDRWSFWRPITAIREAASDGNPRTEPDPTWTPLLVTPPFPEYPSGHAAGTGSRMSAFAAFFGTDRISFSGFSVDANATRHYSSFSQAINEVIGARVWGGIHFRTADVDGTKLGKAITDYAVKRYFRRR
ncbi:MAG TPA: vanadium-dependent haloperoxidase [Natronosporangium sp.]